MPLICYKNLRISDVKQEIIDRVNTVVTDYKAQGYSLTLRQVYYQFVSRDWFPAAWKRTVVNGKLVYSETGSTNNNFSYDALGDAISDGRMAGLIDWNAIVDRQREMAGNQHWDSPAEIIEAVARSYMIDKWHGQPNRVEVWVEKDALKNVVDRAARACDVNYLSCRGYTSQTAMWDGAMRMKAFAEEGIKPVILHLGDHDPSGIDMSRDIEDRTRMFMQEYGDDLIFERIALNMDQVKRYAPPPNPAKMTDSRFADYARKHGKQSWELDALDPSTLDKLIRSRINRYREDADEYDANVNKEALHRTLLRKASTDWTKVAKFLSK